MRPAMRPSARAMRRGFFPDSKVASSEMKPESTRGGGGGANRRMPDGLVVRRRGAVLALVVPRLRRSLLLLLLLRGLRLPGLHRGQIRCAQRPIRGNYLCIFSGIEVRQLSPHL